MTLVSFNGNNGASPFGALLQGSDDNFYGTTAGTLDGSFGGMVFRMTPDGELTNLVTFNLSNGATPSGGLVQDSDGNLYGTTEWGGNLSVNGGYGFGTVFKLTPPKSLRTLLPLGGSNGSYCFSGLVQGSDGNFYGTTTGGGAGGGGTVFKITPAGTLTTLVAFKGSDGRSPQASLIQGSDGNFYGTTKYGGAGGGGTVFQMTPAGTLKTLVAFGDQPNSP